MVLWPRLHEDDVKTKRKVSDTIVFGQSDRRVFTRRRCRDVQRRLRLVRRRSRASLVARRTITKRQQCVDWDTVRLKHIVIGQVFPNVSKNVHQPVMNPLFFSLETFHNKKMRRKYIHRTKKQKKLTQANMTTGTAQSKRKTKEIREVHSAEPNFGSNIESSSSRRLCLIPGSRSKMCYRKTRPNRPKVSVNQAPEPKIEFSKLV